MKKGDWVSDPAVPGDMVFDDFALVAARLCRARYGVVTLIDGARHSVPGLAGGPLPPVPMGQSICRIEIETTDLLVIPDIADDSRTERHPVLQGLAPPRFYAGAVLIASNGDRLGRLCVLDDEPRSGLDDDDARALRALARQVALHVELHRAARENGERARLQAALGEIGQTLRDGTDVEAMMHAANAGVGRVLGVDRTGFGRVDADTETVTYDAGWNTPGTDGIAGRYRFRDFGDLREPLVVGNPLVIDNVDTDPRTAANPAPLHALRIGAPVNMPVRQHGRTIAVLMAQSHKARRWTPAELDFLRAVGDQIEAGGARLLAEEQQRALNGEIAHRLKNTLAMAQAIASQTLRDVTDRDAVDAFERRLLALGTAHDVLTGGDWQATDLRSISSAALAIFGEPGRISIEGGAFVALGPRSAMSLSLLLHELATNAVKYGALSNDVGRIELYWSCDGDELTLCWRECGGPPVAPPTRRGFGSRLVRMGLVGTGGVDIRYDPAGVRADMTATLDQLAEI